MHGPAIAPQKKTRGEPATGSPDCSDRTTRGPKYKEMYPGGTLLGRALRANRKA